jgi:hypothetical protein
MNPSFLQIGAIFSVLVLVLSLVALYFAVARAQTMNDPDHASPLGRFGSDPQPFASDGPAARTVMDPSGGSSRTLGPGPYTAQVANNSVASGAEMAEVGSVMGQR